MDEILQFLRDNKTFYFATVDGDKPRVRPFGLTFIHEGKLYFGMGKHKPSYKQIQINRNVEVSTANDKGEWIRIRGKAVFDESEAAQTAAFEAVPFLTQIYNEKTGFKLGLISLENGEAELCSMQGASKTIQF
jgi:uncharacterized pyridoxamine 5'-phosphate oxidase family protein